MRDIIDTEFAWDFFENTGSIEGYMLYNEYRNLGVGIKTDEYDTDSSTGAKNL